MEQIGRFVFLVQAKVILCLETLFASAVAFQLRATCMCVWCFWKVMGYRQVGGKGEICIFTLSSEDQINNYVCVGNHSCLIKSWIIASESCGCHSFPGFG